MIDLVWQLPTTIGVELVGIDQENELNSSLRMMLLVGSAHPTKLKIVILSIWLIGLVNHHRLFY